MYSFQSRIRYSEIGKDGRLSMESLLDYFQDCSTFHSEDLGIGVDYLGQRGLAWVLSSWQIVVRRYPELGEKITIGTFPYAFKSFLGYRNFIMEDENGDQTALANSLWALVNIDTMKPAKPTPEMLQGYVLEPRLNMEYADRKILVPETAVPQEPVIIKKHHLDTNCHVNNGQYVRIAMDYLPDGFEIRQMRAEYKKPAFLGDTLIPRLAPEPGKRTVSLTNPEGQIYVNVEFNEKQ